MDETYLKRNLCEKIKEHCPGAVIFRHEDKFTAGVPDISVTWNGRTVWIEVKYARPGSPGLLTAMQKLTISRLIKAGRALVVTYKDRRKKTFEPEQRFTILTLPLENLSGEDTVEDIEEPGFNHDWAARKIRGLALR